MLPTRGAHARFGGPHGGGRQERPPPPTPVPPVRVRVQGAAARVEVPGAAADQGSVKPAIPTRFSGPVLGALGGLLLLTACATRTPDQVEDLLFQALRAAETHHEFDLDPEAAVLLDAIYAIDESFPGALDLEEDLDPAARLGMEPSLLGMNRRLRPAVERSPRTRALLWLPDRLLDLLDIVTVGFHLGPGAFADVHLTRGFQLNAGLHSTAGIGLHDFRSVGMKSEAEAGLNVIAFGAHTYGGALVGTTGTYASTGNTHGLHRPMAPLYQELRDYWAIGANATGGILGAEVEFHPLQLVDFFAGFATVDLLRDDLALTRGLKLDKVESRLLAELWRVRSAPKVVAAYLDAKYAGMLSQGMPEPVAEDDPGASRGSAPFE